MEEWESFMLGSGGGGGGGEREAFRCALIGGRFREGKLRWTNWKWASYVTGLGSIQGFL